MYLTSRMYLIVSIIALTLYVIITLTKLEINNKGLSGVKACFLGFGIGSIAMSLIQYFREQKQPSEKK
jgi:hypothetical protein